MSQGAAHTALHIINHPFTASESETPENRSERCRQGWVEVVGKAGEGMRVRKPQITTINHPAVNIFTWCGRAGIGNSQSSLERSQQNNPLAQITLSAGIWQVC